MMTIGEVIEMLKTIFEHLKTFIEQFMAAQGEGEETPAE